MNFDFISIGIDVSANFSWFSIVLPNHKVAVKPFKVFHDSLDSLERAVLSIRKAEELYSLKAKVFLESTGIYHIPLFCYLKEKSFEVLILNPLITDSNKNSGIRKVKNDRLDSIRIAKTGYTDNLKVSLIPSDLVLELRTYTREYYSLVDQRTAYVNKLKANLRVAFPSYIKVFKNTIGSGSMAILKAYKTPQAIINAPMDEILSLISKKSRRGRAFALAKYSKLVIAARDSQTFGKGLAATYELIQHNLEFIEFYNQKINLMLKKIKEFTIEHESTMFVQQIKLIDSIKCVGFMSAVTLMCEIRDFSAFNKPKELFAYFGIDPAVRQSGQFKGTKVSMSKRGSKIARRILYIVALNSVSTSNGKPKNPVLHEFYEIKKKSKPKKVALGAVMHKLANYVFAVLRDNKPFVLKTPEQHKIAYSTGLSLVA